MYATMNTAQAEVMDMMSYINTPSAWERLKEALSDYFANQLENEIELLWQDGTLTDEKVATFASLHERTPYK